MNLPVGEVKEEGLHLSEFNARAKVEALAESSFSGYVAATIEGYAGLEEGVLLFKKGQMVASAYEYLKYGITVFGDAALPQFFNALAAKFGAVDVVALTAQQADLITAFNDKMRLTGSFGSKDVPRLVAKAYTPEYARQVLSEVLRAGETKQEILKRLGLGSLG